MSGDSKLCEGRILRMRIGFALRRATGMVIDVDAMLSRPRLVARRLDNWRALGSPELSALVDQLERELAGEAEGALPVPALRAAPRPAFRQSHA